MLKNLDNTIGIGELAKLLDVSTHALRVWEKRYGHPTPLRLPSGRRRYSMAEVDRLLLVSRALKLGFRAGVVVPASQDHLLDLIERAEKKLIAHSPVTAVRSDGLPVGEQNPLVHMPLLPGCA